MSIEILGEKELLARIEALRSSGQNLQMMKTLGDDVRGRAKLKVPHKTGNLGRSIERGTTTATSVQIVVRGNYGAAVEKGTRPHRITARNKKALAFLNKQGRGSGMARLTGTARSGTPLSVRLPGGGYSAGVVLVPRADVARGRKSYVDHPGTKAQPYMRPAVEEVLRISGIVPKSLDIRWNGAA